MAKWPYSTAQWQRLRMLKLCTTPLCEDCERAGQLTQANHVDHRVPMSSGGPAFPPLDGLASLCAPCHSAKTARGAEAGAVRTTKPRKGCSPDGMPLDTGHPWHARPVEHPSAAAQKSLQPIRPGPPVKDSRELIEFRGKKPAVSADLFHGDRALDDGRDHG